MGLRPQGVYNEVHDQGKDLRDTVIRRLYKAALLFFDYVKNFGQPLQIVARVIIDINTTFFVVAD